MIFKPSSTSTVLHKPVSLLPRLVNLNAGLIVTITIFVFGFFF